jgi:hypothetical protein
LPRRFLRAFQTLPVHVEGNVLHLVMADPRDLETQAAIRRYYLSRVTLRS